MQRETGACQGRSQRFTERADNSLEFAGGIVHRRTLDIDPNSRSVLLAQFKVKRFYTPAFLGLEQTLGALNVFWKHIGE